MLLNLNHSCDFVVVRTKFDGCNRSEFVFCLLVDDSYGADNISGCIRGWDSLVTLKIASPMSGGFRLLEGMAVIHPRYPSGAGAR